VLKHFWELISEQPLINHHNQYHIIKA